jgi:Mce-associated membrane protein
MAEPADPAGKLTLLLDDDVVDIEDAAAEAVAEDTTDAPDLASKEPMSAVRRAMLFGVVVVLASAVLLGWSGFRAYQSHEGQAQRSQFLQAATQGALNLSTIDWQQAERDVQRILDGATGQFYDDFATRSQPFVDVVKEAKSTSVGTITEAGLESEGVGSAQVLVAVAVKTSKTGAPEQDLRAWRMRMFVEKVGDQAKVSNVEFVS